MGSYLCILKKEGYRDARYPIHITRNREWADSVRLRTDSEIGDGFVFVPAGGAIDPPFQQLFGFDAIGASGIMGFLDDGSVGIVVENVDLVHLLITAPAP